VHELGTPWNHAPGPNNTLVVRISRLLMDETNVETLLQQNNRLFRKKFIGSVDSNGETYLQDRSDVIKYNDSSDARSRNSSPRASSRKKSNSTMDRGNIDKSNESLNLNNFDVDQGNEKFGGSTHFGSTESLLERRSDHGNDVDQDVSASMLFDSRDSIFQKGADDIFNNKEKLHKSANYDSMETILEERDDDDVSDDTKIAASTHFGSMDSIFQEGARVGDDYYQGETDKIDEPSKYRNKHKKFSITTGMDIDDEVNSYVDGERQRNKFTGSRNGDSLETIQLGETFGAADSMIGLEKLSPYLQSKAQGRRIKKKRRGLFSALIHTEATKKNSSVRYPFSPLCRGFPFPILPTAGALV
ncbi:hypothetical protein AK88_03558, partial [Plasmodium fragile]